MYTAYGVFDSSEKLAVDCSDTNPFRLSHNQLQLESIFVDVITNRITHNHGDSHIYNSWIH